jgi:hypothetical protein
MVEVSGKRWKNEQFRWQFAVFLLVIPLIAPHRDWESTLQELVVEATEQQRVAD